MGVKTLFLMDNKITKTSGRGGIILFLRYVEMTLLFSVIEHIFSELKIFGSKGLQLN